MKKIVFFTALMSYSILTFAGNCDGSQLTINNNTDEALTVSSIEGMHSHRVNAADSIRLAYDGRLRGLTTLQTIPAHTSVTARAYSDISSIKQNIKLRGSDDSLIDIDVTYDVTGYIVSGMCEPKLDVISHGFQSETILTPGKPANAIVTIN